ncbi:glycosyltransferase [Terriglobus roseus DSM 18391]|uniref:Glycosyltransferase n=1 Tax=Terriglobus roseus (strain DSM 18391 / NRRL B-41598 / KBS 63) TaxID=926566 RepID=I3ZMV0_TERRK|nr:glycosyltransferase family 1 protein [Terriglobus roseus]AFL90568.1 glycosyltransferase [Terriglobus roseus DSM 18391]
MRNSTPHIEPLAVPERRIAINGRFLTQAITGVQRYALEVVRALDKLLADGLIPTPTEPVQILAPPGTHIAEPFQTLQLRHVGHGNGQLWEQLSLPLYCRNAVLFTPAGGSPLLHRRHVFTLPDAGVFATPQAYTAAYRAWYSTHHRLAVTNPDLQLLTVSQFSRRELARTLHLDPAKIAVTLEGHEHALAPTADPTILGRLGLHPGGFLLGVGSANPNKNFQALLAAFGILRDTMPPDTAPTLVVVGGGDARIFGADAHALEGVVRAGYLTDGELRALYEAAAAFLFPSTYEGFGLPPLEAMALGCPVICSNAASLPEVVGNAALMVDPHDAPAIAAAMRTLLTDAAARHDLIGRGRAQAARFTWEATAIATWNLLLASARTQ